MNARMFFVNSENYARESAKLLNLSVEQVRTGNYLFVFDAALSKDEIGFLDENIPGMLLSGADGKRSVFSFNPFCVDFTKALPAMDSFPLLHEMVLRIEKYFNSKRAGCWKLRQGRCLDFNHLPLIMGILNVTPDSFSDGGQFFDKPKALEQARKMIADGVDIIDVGGESSRPGAKPVSMEQEMERVIPIIQAIRSESSVVISIDTYKSPVAKAALEAGADIINDISGTDFDTNMKKVIEESACPVIIMHMQGTPRTMQKNPDYKNVLEEVGWYLQKKADEIAYLNDGRVILDPGIGFGKTLEHNLKLIAHIKDFTFYGYPLLVGLSRKSFIGKVLDNDVQERLAGGLTAELHCIQNGADIIRVHDVKAAVDARKMQWAIQAI